ncbi:MAG: creatininase family protein [Candidatus Thorarchaeota archaeon]|nr:creatininase family protein [Candidatus Thorarchaeota archaeon]
MPLWSELTRREFQKASRNTHVVLMVTGALEPHGMHMALGTDIILPTYLAEKIAKRTEAMVLPAIPFGDSWSFDLYEGTVSVSPETLVSLYADVMTSVFRNGFRYLVALNGHGPNATLLEQAAKKATMAGERVVIIVNWWIDLAKDVRKIVLESPEGHAAEDETSELMFIRPDLVDISAAMKKSVKTKYRIVSAGYREELYPAAILGDPTLASEEKGRLIIEQAETELVELISQLERGEVPLEKEPRS